ncbi:hypothetical protein KFL_000790050 [Klebsormidium nitens]|uniref:Uncharacterized protein n=1 Tax=Klebsormidium nitens TaxID=105231 RepID=A0A1Y1HRX8_KLENI|nr:hypothetical protein KFL_000790050 [Klebsormidium nitens]|eukprot:GAQ81380.1 hypothetical protein KFL_000790050 [Klebsormidium nitens]
MNGSHFMSCRKRLRDLSNLDIQARLQEVMQGLRKLSWRSAEACEGLEARVGGRRWLDAPEKIDVGAWVVKEQKVAYGVWPKRAVCETFPEKFLQEHLRVMVPSEFGEHTTAFSHAPTWLHFTEALPCEAVMEVLSATVLNKPQKLTKLIANLPSTELVAVNDYAEEHQIAISVGSQPADHPGLGSAAKPQRATMVQMAPKLGSEGSVNQGTPFPPRLGKPATTSFVVIRISDGSKGKDAWRLPFEISRRAGTSVYRRKEEDLPALLARLQEAEAKRLGVGPLKVFCIADKSNEALSVLVKTGKVHTYLSGTNDLLFTDAAELEYALATGAVHLDLKTTKEATGVVGQGIYQLWAGIAYGEIPPLSLITDLSTKCTLTLARDCTVDGGPEDCAIEVYEDVNPSTALSVAFAWNVKARQQLAGEKGLPEDFVRGGKSSRGGVGPCHERRWTTF